MVIRLVVKLFEPFAPGFTVGPSQTKAAKQRGLVLSIQLTDAGRLRRRRMTAAMAVRADQYDAEDGPDFPGGEPGVVQGYRFVR